MENKSTTYVGCIIGHHDSRKALQTILLGRNAPLTVSSDFLDANATVPALAIKAMIGEVQATQPLNHDQRTGFYLFGLLA